MGPDGYFSFKEDGKAWREYQKGMEAMKKVLLEKPFIPNFLKKEDDNSND